MRLTPVLFILMLQFVCGGIDAQLKVTTLRLGRDNGLAYAFPFVCSVNKQIAQNINGFLQSKILDNETVLSDTNSVFDKSRFIETDSVHQSGYTSIDYSVIINSSRILSIEFQLETMGAYPESYVNYYSFDMRSGDPVNADNLFTTEGLKKIRQYLIAERKKRIKANIKDYEDGQDSLAEYDLDYMKERFDECNEDSDVDHIFIEKNAVLFYKDYCFPHAARNLDIGLDVELSFNTLEKYLSVYGKQLLLNRRSASNK